MFKKCAILCAFCFTQRSENPKSTWTTDSPE
jgi:hypothetical protein